MFYVNRTRIKESPEALLLRYGEDILRHEKFLTLKNDRHHKYSNTYDHSVMVTLKAIRMAKRLRIRVDQKSLVRGCLLHDYYLYNPHGPDKKPVHLLWHGYRAVQNAMEDFGLNAIEVNMIENHMWPISLLRYPVCAEGWFLLFADKYVSFFERFKKGPKKKK